MQLRREVVVGFIGQWAETPDWQKRVKRSMAQVLSSLPKGESMDGDTLMMAFVGSISLSRSKIFPHGVQGAQHAERCQEILIARQVDITVMVNPGIAWDSKSVIAHLDVLEQVAKILIVWTPQGVSEDLPTEEDMATKPGVIPVKGGFATLSKMIAYLASSDNMGVLKLNAPDLRDDDVFPRRKKVSSAELESELSGEGIDQPLTEIPQPEGEERDPDAFEVGAASQ